jgi:hypothetical protein
VDAWHFEGLIDQAAAAAYPAWRKRRLEEAVALYAPPVAGQDSSGPFWTPYADRLRGKYERAITATGRMLIEAGKPGEAASIYHQGLCVEQNSEPILQALQGLFAAGGANRPVEPHAQALAQHLGRRKPKQNAGTIAPPPGKASDGVLHVTARAPFGKPVPAQMNISATDGALQLEVEDSGEKWVPE